MSKFINVYALPEIAEPSKMKGDTAIVVDVLRATTTMITALAHGAEEVRPFLELSQTLDAKKEYCETFPEKSLPLLGGERDGIPIPGFDLGNSPLEYTEEKVGKRVVFFTTTNGTKAMYRAGMAREIFPAAFVNSVAVLEKISNRDRIHIICAGTDGHYTEEDMLLAGLLVSRLQHSAGIGERPYEMNVEAVTVQMLWEETFPPEMAFGVVKPDPKLLAKELRKSRGGKNLLEIGRVDDILAAAMIDSVPVVPKLDPVNMRCFYAPKSRI